MKKDLNYIAAVEKAITEKYGKNTVQDFRHEWPEHKEKEYLDELKSNYRYDKAESERVDLNGVLISEITG